MGRTITFILSVLMACAAFTAYAENTQQEALDMIDSTKWQYNEADGVYWQTGVAYCANPADTQYETLGVFVPEAYFDATDNGDGTFTCTLNTANTLCGYTALTAPIVLPVETPGYAAMAAPTGYVSAAAQYTQAGFVYVMAGCRGRDAGAPAGVTDLKAAVRYLRYSTQSIAGNTDCIFTFGMSGGGAQSALMGATGNSALYEPYLAAIGAAEGFSDAVAGCMCWCPITNLDMADAAYEWNMGLTRSGLDEQTQALSDGLSAAYAGYINALGLTDAQGNVLSLNGENAGVLDSGSYIDALKALIETSLNHFLEDTQFPYTPASGKGMDGMGGRGGMRGERGDGQDGEHTAKAQGALTDQDWAEGRVDDGVARTQQAAPDAQSETVTYETAADYIAALNGDTPWIEYDSQTNTATLLSIEGFVKACKNASKSVGAFDDLNKAQAENTLFGYGDGEGAHFDPVLAGLLEGTEYADAFAADLSRADSLGNTVDVRMDMYNPMYFIEDYYAGYRSADVATFWRIRTGINQGDTALTTEMNLALALQAYGAQVDFETVWGQGHVQAERTGSSTENFIAWVNQCVEAMYTA